MKRYWIIMGAVLLTAAAALGVSGDKTFFVPDVRTINGKRLNANVTLSATDVGAEANLGNPAADGYKLVSTMAGARSWVADNDVLSTSTVTSGLSGLLKSSGNLLAPATANIDYAAPSMFNNYTGMWRKNGSLINTTSKVGINKAAPAALLDIVTDNVVNTSLLKASGTIGTTYIDYMGMLRTNVNAMINSVWTGDIHHTSTQAATTATTIEFRRADSGIILQVMGNGNAYFNALTLPYGSTSNVGIGTTSPTSKLHIASSSIRIDTAKTPASATDTGNVGDICWDANYVYVCVATNTWKRSALSTW